MASWWTCTMLSFLTTIQCVAQLSRPDTAFISAAKSNQKQLYKKFIHGQSRLNNGSAYRDYFSKNDEHPYFGVDDWAYGYIIYDDELYTDVAMFYDLSRDKVIAEHSLSGTKLELVSEKIKQFSLADHVFIRLGKNESSIIPEGFFELLYDGTTKVYARREKILNEKIESNEIITKFDDLNRIYIQKDGTYFFVNKKKSVLDVFIDKKQELKTFLTKNKINYNGDREKAIVRMAEFYDAQKNQS